MGELTVSLYDPGMTALHRAGVAGLYATVKALREREVKPKGLVGWETSRDTVTMRWKGKAEPFFDDFAKKAFRVAKDGLIDFAALDQGNPSFESRWIVHEGMLNSFCQFGPTNGLSKERRSKVVSQDNGKPAHFEYRAIDTTASKRGARYPHHDKGGAVVGAAIDAGTNVELVGWLLPGAVVRHTAFKAQTAFDELPSRALSLLFAPVGCFFFKIQSQRHSRKARMALLIPDVRDLEVYARARVAGPTEARIGEVITTSAGHAALQLLTWLQARSKARDLALPRIAVVTLGIVTWNEKQKSRTGQMDVEVRGERALTLFQKVRKSLRETVVDKKDGGTFLSLSPSLELFTDNIATGRPFFEGFVSLVINKDTRTWLRGDQKGLAMLVAREQGAIDDDVQRAFIEACHQALRRCYGMTGDRAKGEGVDVGARMRKEYDRWQYAFSKAKNAKAFRESVTQFWSRGGGVDVLRANWRSVLPMLGPTRWQEGRDLALLALASYARQEPTADAGITKDGEDDQ